MILTELKEWNVYLKAAQKKFAHFQVLCWYRKYFELLAVMLFYILECSGRFELLFLMLVCLFGLLFLLFFKINQPIFFCLQQFKVENHLF